MSTADRVLWQPSREFSDQSNLNQFLRWLNQQQSLHLANYHDAWEWSTRNYKEFWSSLLSYFKVIHDGCYTEVVSQEEMPGIKWFEGIRLNYAEHIFAQATTSYPAIISSDETGETKYLSWAEVTQGTASLRAYLSDCGVRKGDCVVGYLPNIPEATIAFLAANSLGAIWSSCSPDFGTQAIVDRFAQIKPKVLIAIDSYRYGGKSFDKRQVIQEVIQAIPSIQKTILINTQSRLPSGPIPIAIGTNAQRPNPSTGDVLLQDSQVDWQDTQRNRTAIMEFERVDFNDPIWVLYSSGTTGLPKAITHSQGGVLLEQLKYLTFHQDVHPGDRCFWYTTTGWMMWNYIQGCLLCGGTIVLYDGSPAFPSINVLWKLIQDTKINHFGTSAGFILANIKAGTSPGKDFDLDSIKSINSTGSTLPPEGFNWIYQHTKENLWLSSMSGGTDVCSAFVGGNPMWPVYSGEIQCRALGCSLEAWDDEGHSIQPGGGEGEMVITRPMPCMPIFLWNDPDYVKYNESYFSTYPGVWRHGDWIQITRNLGVIIYGRSDATLNRDGVRIGTSEIYRGLDKIDEVSDSLIICVERPGGKFYMPLFVILKAGVILNDALKQKINKTLKQEYSPRHVPDVIIPVHEIPYTISGKKTETPVKKILMGRDPSKVISTGSLRNPESLQFFIQHYQDIQSKK